MLSCCNITNVLNNKEIIKKCENLYIDKDASGGTLGTLSPEVQVGWFVDWLINNIY